MIAESVVSLILIVDDNAGDVFLVERALEANNLNCQIVHYEDGEHALEALADAGRTGGPRTPDLILLDLNLPRIDGIDVLRIIRQTPDLAGVPIAILTSSESPSDRHSTGLIGVNRYIVKPLRLEDFYTQVGGAIKSLLEEFETNTNAGGRQSRFDTT
jgi:CheY-like chemotaxis protein